MNDGEGKVSLMVCFLPQNEKALFEAFGRESVDGRLSRDSAPEELDGARRDAVLTGHLEEGRRSVGAAAEADADCSIVVEEIFSVVGIIGAERSGRGSTRNHDRTDGPLEVPKAVH